MIIYKVAYSELAARIEDQEDSLIERVRTCTSVSLRNIYGALVIMLDGHLVHRMNKEVSASYGSILMYVIKYRH